MDFKKINELIDSNKEEITRFKESDNLADKDYVNYLMEENRKLEEFKSNYSRKAEQLLKLESLDKKDKNVNSQIKKLRSEMKDDVKKIEKTSQGKLRNVFSTLIGQVDKKVHNWWYREGKDTRWNNHVEKVNERYKNIPKYLLKNTGIAAGIFLGMGAVVLLIPATSAVLTPVIWASTAAFIGQTAVKAGAAIYNKIKFGGPLLERTKKLFKGSYTENIQNALCEKRSSKNIFQRVKEISYRLVGKPVKETETVKEEKNEEKIEEKVDKKVEKTKEESLSLTDDVRKAIETLNSVNLETATLEELKKVINEVKMVRDKLPHDALEKYNKIYAKAEMLFAEMKEKAEITPVMEEKKDDVVEEPVLSGKEEETELTPVDTKKEETIVSKKKTVKKELSLNELINSVDIDMIRLIVNSDNINDFDEKISTLNKNQKKVFYSQLLTIKRIINMVSYGNIDKTELDGASIKKLAEIVNVFGNNNDIIDNRINNAKYKMVDKIVVKVYEALEQSTRHLSHYTGNCVFYSGRNKIDERMLFLENDDEEYIENTIRSALNGYNGTIEIVKQYGKTK